MAVRPEAPTVGRKSRGPSTKRSSDDLQQLLILALANSAGDIAEARLDDRLNELIADVEARVEAQMAGYIAQLSNGVDTELVFERARQAGVANYWDLERERITSNSDAYKAVAGAVDMRPADGHPGLERRAFSEQEIEELRANASATPGPGFEVHHLDSVKGADPGTSVAEQLRRALDPSQMVAATPDAHLQVLHGGNTQMATHSSALPVEASNDDMAESAGDSAEWHVGLGLSGAMVGANGLLAGFRHGGRAALFEVGRSSLGAAAGLAGARGTSALVGALRRTSAERLAIGEEGDSIMAIDLGEWPGFPSPGFVSDELQAQMEDLFGEALDNLDMVGGRAARQFVSAFMAGGSWEEGLSRGLEASIQGGAWTAAEVGTEFVMELIQEGASELGLALVGEAAGALATGGVSLVITGARLGWKAHGIYERRQADKAVQALTWQHQVDRARKVVSELSLTGGVMPRRTRRSSKHRVL
jgi:hypothetical protein